MEISGIMLRKQDEIVVFLLFFFSPVCFGEFYERIDAYCSV